MRKSHCDFWRRSVGEEKTFSVLIRIEESRGIEVREEE
jgi:hypothetical protein